MCWVDQALAPTTLMALKFMERYPKLSTTPGPLIVVCHSVPGRCHAWHVMTCDFQRYVTSVISHDWSTYCVSARPDSTMTIPVTAFVPDMIACV